METKIVTVYAMYMDWDRGGQRLEGVVPSIEEARRLSKGNAYLSFRQREAIQIGDRYVLVDETTSLFKEH